MVSAQRQAGWTGGCRVHMHPLEVSDNSSCLPSPLTCTDCQYIGSPGWMGSVPPSGL
jgi:hypothetical protein